MIEMKMTRRNETRIDFSCRMEGSTDALLDELAAGMARAIVRIADDLPVVDDIHESLARVMASRMIDMVLSELDLREKQSFSHPAAAGDLIRQPDGLTPSPEGKALLARDKLPEA